MKRIGIFSIASVVAVLLILVGCGGDDNGDGLNGPDDNGYGGFPPAGSWARHIDHTAYQKPFMLKVSARTRLKVRCAC